MSFFKIPLVLRNRSLILLLLARTSTAFAFQMLSVAVGWQIYSITGSAFYLGLVGLVQFIPMFVLTLVVGYVADHFDRRRVVSICQIVEGIGMLIIAFGSFGGWITKEIILVTIFIISIGYAFQNPSMQSLLPNVVEKKLFPQAAAWTTSAFQSAVIAGPAIGGFLYAFGPGFIYVIASILCLFSCVVMFFIVTKNEQKKSETADTISLKSVFAGLTFIKSKPIILGAISLDLFAVLFGGATALLPVYASKVLNVGPQGLGFLRSAPAVGALIVSIYLARKPVKRNVGIKMFISVMIFGLATVVFAISKNFILSLTVLAILGAADVISVVIRATLIQIETPDDMRGRVNSVNMMFIGTSNQLGEFESGFTASIFGIVPSVVIGGIGTIVVVLMWMKLFPSLLKADRLVK